METFISPEGVPQESDVTDAGLPTITFKREIAKKRSNVLTKLVRVLKIFWSKQGTGATMMILAKTSLLLLTVGLAVLETDARTLLWSDEFRSKGAPNASIWSYDIGAANLHGELQEYRTDNVRVEGGNLVITVDEEHSFWSGRTITSGRIRSNKKFEFQYGTVEASIKVPDAADGLHPTFWMLGSSFEEVGWPGSGEISVMKVGSSRAIQLDEVDTRVSSAVSWEENGKLRNENNEIETDFDLDDGFRTYRLEWTPESITTYVEDDEIFYMDISENGCSGCEELHQPFFFVLNVAAGGGFSRIYREDEVTAPLPAEMLVDWIRVYDNGFSQQSSTAAPETTTSKPTSKPTTEPTASPMSSPTRSPTLAPTTSAPKLPPTLARTTGPPTMAPTSSTTVESTPTSSPPKAAVQRFLASGIQMKLGNVKPLDPVASLRWAEVTGNHLSAEITEIIGYDLVEAVVVSVTLVSQDPPYEESRRSLKGSALHVTGRALQVEQELTFDAMVLIQSVVDNHDVNRYIAGAFNVDAERKLYLAMLKATGDDTFKDASTVSVSSEFTVSGVESSTDDNDNNDEGGLLNVVIGIAAALGCVALLVLGAFCLYIRRKKRGSRTTKKVEHSGLTKKSGKKLKAETATAHKNSKKQSNPIPDDTSSDFDDDSLYNINSSLEDVTPSTSSPDDDESLFTSPSQQTADYDFNVAFRQNNGSVAETKQTFFSGFAMSTYTDFLTNGGMPLNEFEVEAPAGKLGLIIDTSKEGLPVVSEVKKSSPMAGKVKEGDWLLALDGRDVTMMIATTVSRVIASKENNKVRCFTFARPDDNSVNC